MPYCSEECLSLRYVANCERVWPQSPISLRITRGAACIRVWAPAVNRDMACKIWGCRALVQVSVMSRKADWAAVKAGADLQSSLPFSLELGKDHPPTGDNKRGGNKKNIEKKKQ